jgi:hypothetical protein
VERFLKYCSPI